MTTSQKLAALAGTGALVLLAALPAACAPKVPSTANAKAEALRELRDSGAITPEQYVQDLAALRSSAMRQTAATPVSFTGGQRQHEIDDPQLGMAAARVTTPADWRFQGEITRPGECATPPGMMRWRTEAPDGAYGVEVSALNYGMSTSREMNAQMQQHGCILSGATQADAILRAYAEQRRPGGRIVGSETFSNGDAMLQQQRMQIQNQMASLPPELQGRVPPPVASGARVTIAYTSGGREMEEAVSGVDVCYSSQSMNYGGPPTQTQTCLVNPLMIVHAPAGKLADFGPKAMSLIKLDNNPAYLRAMAQASGSQRQNIINGGREQVQQTDRENQSRIDNIWRNNKIAIDNIHSIGDRAIAIDRQRSDSFHEQNRRFAKSLNDQQDFNDGSGHTFTGSNQYKYTYVDGRGNAYQTNSNDAPGAEWTQAQPR